MEKICKYCSNYNKGKCSILNEKLSTDVSLSYRGVLNIIENFFNNNFRLYLPPEDLEKLATQLSDKIESFVEAEIENPIIYNDETDDFSCNNRKIIVRNVYTHSNQIFDTYQVKQKIKKKDIEWTFYKKSKGKFSFPKKNICDCP